MEIMRRGRFTDLLIGGNPLLPLFLLLSSSLLSFFSSVPSFLPFFPFLLFFFVIYTEVGYLGRAQA